MSELRADEVWLKFVREVRHRLGHAFQFVRVKEPFEFRNGVHIHFLACDCRNLMADDLKAWAKSNLGKLDLEPYDPTRGARFYVCKMVAQDNSTFPVDIRFSPQIDKFQGPKKRHMPTLVAGPYPRRTPGIRFFRRSNGPHDERTVEREAPSRPSSAAAGPAGRDSRL
jgi:hypothetical protein